MSQHIPSRYLDKPEAIAEDMTLLRYYRPFLSQARYLEIRDAMVQPNTQKRVIPSLSPLKLGRTDCLRFCRKCWQEDKASESLDRYWRRSHQAPGCCVCPIHGINLSRSPVLWSFRESWQAYIDAVSVNPQDCSTEQAPGQNRSVYERLSQDIHWLLTGSVPAVYVEDITREYWRTLTEFRLIRGPHVHASALTEIVIEKIGHSALRHLKSEIRKDDGFNWVSGLLRWSRVRKSGQSPLRHLLLIQALGHSAESFFKLATEPHPFRLSSPIGHEISPKVAKDTLEKNISDWWADLSMSRNEMCRKLGITTNRLNAIAVGLKLPFPRGGKWGSKMLGAGLAGTTDEILPSKRMAFRALLEKHPNLGMEELRKLAPPLLGWLRRHDPEWLRAHRPARKQGGGAPRLDWATRDAMCAKRIPSILRDLASTSRGPSLSAIERELRVRFDGKEDRLPRAMKLLSRFKRQNKPERQP